MSSIKKFVAIGPESTGKSTLCQQLANHYQTLWCPEYARAFFENRSPEYQFEDLKLIAKGQLQLEDEKVMELQKSSTSNLLFVDTDLYVIKVWSEFVFDRCDNFILNQISQRKYDAYFLCYPDLPWEADPLRELPDVKKREEIFCHYKELLSAQSTPWCIVSGNENDRMQKAISFVEEWK